ncbi:MAG: carbohydrate-binding domain-containing protein [Oscillospiraceae bacterium]|nr:carbohydrate-binding domain-containing protein [Oscillospiraceae bacterium]
MKKTLITLLIFAVVLAVLLGAAYLAERYVGAGETAEPEPTAAPAIANALNETGAVTITLSGTEAHISGVGATAADGVVTIVYPGTYRVTGALTEGQLLVNCGDYDGAVYIILDGADISCSDGPALYVAQADETVIVLAEGTESILRDGADYTIQEGQSQQAGAAIYSADELVIQGDGSLTVIGRTADGIRSKDGLTIEAGSLSVTAADDGIQGSDHVTVTGGAVTVLSGGDGVHTTEGDVTISGGSLTVTSGGDGIDAAAQVCVTGGMLDITAGSGPENYAAIALADASAKGMKGAEVLIADGTVTISAADDGLHGDAVTVTGGTVTIATGDDALRADGTVTVTGGIVTVTESYEALEGAEAVLSGGTLTLAADTNGMDIGTGGLKISGGSVALTAARPVTVDGEVLLVAGEVYLTATGEEAPMEFGSIVVTGATLAVFANVDDAVFQEGGTVPGSLLFTLPAAAEAGTTLTLADAAGRELLALTTEESCISVLIASGALAQGQSYTLTAGDTSLTGTLSADCTVVSYEAAYAAASGEMWVGGAMDASMEMGASREMGASGEMPAGGAPAAR